MVCIYVDDAEVLIDFSFAVFTYCVTILKLTFYDEKEEQNACACADNFRSFKICCEQQGRKRAKLL